MKALFIWREGSKQYLKKIIGENQFNDGIKFISSQKDFDAFIPKSNEELGVRLKTETKKANNFKSYTKIYILAELAWNENKLFEGYEKGFRIIEKWGSNNAPHIEFFSVVNQTKISQMVPDKLKFIVKAFPFIDLLNIKSNYKFNTENINQYKWDYFLYLTLSSYGILDNLAHRLDSINSSNPNFEARLDELIIELSAYKEFAGEAILNFTSNVSFTNDYVFRLKLLLNNRINEIRGDKITKIDLPTSIKILVIDDNVNDLELIKNSLNRYSNNYVKTTTSGEEAINLINDSGNLFNIVISDLELLDSKGFYQDIQGVEIFEAVKKSDGMVIGIISGLGRKGIAKLLKINEDVILPKKHLHRFDINEELDNLLKSLLLDFKIKENRLCVLYGPKKGTYFGIEGFKTSLAKAFSDKIFKQQAWDYAFKILDKFITKDLKFSDWDKNLNSEKNKKNLNSDEFIDLRLKSLLAQRLILIFLALKNDGIILPNELEEEYFEILEENKININKGYVNRISILYNTKGLITVEKDSTGKRIETFKGWRFEARDLLPEELAYIGNYDQEKLESNFKIYIKDNSPLTFEWLKKYFDFEDDWYAIFKVPNHLDDWVYEDLNKACKFIYSDFIKDPAESIYKDSLMSINEYFTVSIENELFPILPELEAIFKKIGQLLLNLNE